MQERFVEILNPVNIPLTGNRFTIDRNGEVFDSYLNSLVTRKLTADKEPVVTISDGVGWYDIKLAVLISIITKKIRLPYRLWQYLNVDYLDSNPENFYPSNTVWQLPIGGLPYIETSDFFVIPGFSRYVIRKDGVVFSNATNKNLSPYQDKLGYWMYGMQPDVGRRTIVGMHRLLALAFLQYGANVDSLDVNHRNGIKSDNCLGNLEWVSRKQNCDHAYSTGLREDNIGVVVRNVFSGELHSFYSISECARRMGLNIATTCLRIRTKGQKLFPPGLQFKAKTDDTPWQIHSDVFKAVCKSGLKVPIIVTNLKTGIVYTFQSTEPAANLIGLSPAGLSYNLHAMGKSKIIKEFKVEYPDFESLAKSSFLVKENEYLF